jgi:hypothetical protein
MKRIIIIGGVMGVMACGMPEMPERVPASERQVQTDAAAASAPPHEAASTQNTSGTGPSSATDSSSVSTATQGPAASSAPSAIGAKPPTVVKATALPLVINEILYDLPGDDTNGDLFVELRGTPGGDLGGIKLSFINGDDGKETESVTIPPGLQVPSDGLFVIADGITGDLQHTHVANADYLDNFDPQNGPDSVQLLSPEGKLLDAVSYGVPKQSSAVNGLAMLEGQAGPDAPLSKSISRLPDADDTHDNSHDFVINAKPSPGEYDVESAL